MIKKLFFIFFIYFILVQFTQANIEVKARTAILQDFSSGEILYEKEPDR